MLFHSVKNIKIVMYYLCKKRFRFYKYKHKVSFDTSTNLYFYNSCVFICKIIKPNVAHFYL